jgi:glucosamine 6-phosphate synthetase-like amidotransferase/phosphosugar isomerase protein
MEYYFGGEGQKLFAKVIDLLSSVNYTRVIFIGNSFNYFASFVPVFCLTNSPGNLNYGWQNFEVNEFYDYILPGKPLNNTLYIFISKSGRSRLIQKSMKHLFEIKTDPRLIWLVTNEPELKIAQKCGIVFPIHVKTETIPGTRSFQNEVFVLYLISQLLLKKDLQEMIESTRKGVITLVQSMKKYWHNREKTTSEIVEYLGGDLQYLYLISKGTSLSTVYEAAASAKSYASLFAEGIDFGLFFHGPFQIADATFRCVLIIDEIYSEQINSLIEGLVNQITSRLGQTLLITTSKKLSALIASVDDKKRVYSLNFDCEIPALTPIFEMFVLHQIFLEISKIRGLVL